MVDLKVDKRTRDVVREETVAHNEIVTRTVTPDPAVSALVEEAATKSAPIANEQVGAIGADLVRAAAPSGESPLGDVLADAQLAATEPNGAQLKTVLEQQWQPQDDGTVQARILQISSTLTYTWSASAPVGSKISDLRVAGEPVTDAAQYRVSVNNFLAAGGDGFAEFVNGTDLAGGAVDLDAFTAYLTANPNLAPPPADRITVAP